MKYLVIDIETTGLDPERHQILEIAAAVLDDELEIADRFHAIVKHEELTGNIYALNMHRELIELFISEESGAENIYVNVEVNLIPDFVFFLEKHFKDSVGYIKDQTIPVLGKNVGFDLSFLETKLNLNDIFHHQPIDPTIFFTRKDDVTPPNLETCYNRLIDSLQRFPDYPHLNVNDISREPIYHTAEEDVNAVIKLFKFVEWFKERYYHE